MVLSLCVRSVPAAAGPVLPNGPAGLPDAIKRELQRLQHVSKQTHFSRSVKQLLLQQMTLHVRLSLFTLAEVVKVLMTPFCFQTVWSDDFWAGLSGWGVFTAEERSHAQQSSRWRTAGTYCAVYCNFKGTYWIFFCPVTEILNSFHHSDSDPPHIWVWFSLQLFIHSKLWSSIKHWFQNVQFVMKGLLVQPPGLSQLSAYYSHRQPNVKQNKTKNTYLPWQIPFE